MLIGDDQNFARTVIKSQLGTIEGIEIIEAENGNQALGKAKVAIPILIFLDLIMPSKDGFETLKELKENERTKNIPVIVVTAVEDAENIAKVRKLGAEKIINKNDLDKTDFIELAKKYL
ncbi:TPA: two-component system response regulator [Candidatus Falkowbacteria bacterium]|nr:two-component system response regulator [Candidatus Falkowbacteria bacterium]HAY12112.1 two-component system response regulator [Candidatus Falkowbacteria bacterium]HBI97273.1 two-component system response regulator [Candidatus Falkowbacteria bacterium]HBT28016.1 two-component system response regulator [Candidatus Falkowbacteria bacterium]HBY14480.1 two-component system response regulator [Candidatus Falkowbacteria bacterium]